MPSIISDDIGSFPLPPATEREKLRSIGCDTARGTASPEDREHYEKTIGDMMEQKVSAGINAPNYPQVQDMIECFADPIKNRDSPDEPWVIETKNAVIPEVEALEPYAKRYHEEHGKPLSIRICVTGPLDLYLAMAGSSVEGDLLRNLGRSVAVFIRNSTLDRKHIKTSVVCIDEPSLGLNPNVYIKEEDVIEAWEAALKGTRVDTQIHLHSVNGFDTVCQAPAIDVIGLEYAGHPKVLDLVDRRELESCDKFLRVGIARTDIDAMVAEYKDTRGVDLWKTGEFHSLLTDMETQNLISKRLRKAYDAFGERIRYAGPDCGLGSWPAQALAKEHLKNTAEAISGFRA